MRRWGSADLMLASESSVEAGRNLDMSSSSLMILMLGRRSWRRRTRRGR